MGTHVHERVDLRDLAQPQPEGEQRMARRQRGIVIVGAPLARAAAIGRQRDGDVAEPAGAEPERAVAHVGIVRPVRPRPRPCALQLRRKFGEQPRIVVERQGGGAPMVSGRHP